MAGFWKTMYDEGLRRKEKYNGDSFADGKAAMSIVGPWAVSTYEGKIDWAVPVPTRAGVAATDATFTDAKNIAIYSSCKARHGLGPPQVRHERGPGRPAAEDDRPDAHAQGHRAPYAAYFTAHPDYVTFAAEAAHVVEVPNVTNSVEVWQAFRDAWSSSVIFGKTDPATSLTGAATKIDQLVAQ